MEKICGPFGDLSDVEIKSNVSELDAINPWCCEDLLLGDDEHKAGNEGIPNPEIFASGDAETTVIEGSEQKGEDNIFASEQPLFDSENDNADMPEEGLW